MAGGEIFQAVLTPHLRLSLGPSVEIPNDAQLYRQRLDQPYWFSLLPERQSLYYKYNRCEGRNDFAALNEHYGQQ